MVSVISPGPNAMPQPMQAGRRLQHLGHHEHDRRRRHVADIAAAPRATPPSAVGREAKRPLDRIEHGAAAGMHRPQIDLVDRPCRRGYRRALHRAAPRGSPPAPGRTAPCRNPSSRICQLISSALLGHQRRHESSRARCRAARPVTSEAAQPSPNRQKESIFSRSVVSCRCSVHSSRLTTRTRACGSERTIWRASLRALIAA